MPVASLTSVTLTFAKTAPLGSATRPMMRPPVPCAKTSVEQIRHRQAIARQTTARQRAKRSVRDCGIDKSSRSRGQIRNFQTRFSELVGNVNLAIIAQG